MPRKQLNIGLTPAQYEAVRMAAEEEGQTITAYCRRRHHGEGSAGAGSPTWPHCRPGCSTSCYSSPGARRVPLCRVSSGVLGEFAMQLYWPELSYR